MFRDRNDAGRRLAEALKAYERQGGLVLGLPRGGVPVAAEVAEKLGLELDVLLVRKIGAPFNPELALGAISEDGTLVYDARVLSELDISVDFINREAMRQAVEMDRRGRLFCAGRTRPDLRGRTVILVDDGLATGATMEAAVEVAHARGAARVVVAVPVGPPETVARLKRKADEVICLEMPPFFLAISQFYGSFPQVDDAIVVELLEKAAPQREPRPEALELPRDGAR